MGPTANWEPAGDPAGSLFKKAAGPAPGRTLREGNNRGATCRLHHPMRPRLYTSPGLVPLSRRRTAGN